MNQSLKICTDLIMDMHHFLNIGHCTSRIISSPVASCQVYTEFRRAKNRAFSPIELKSKNSDALQKIISHTYETVPFYREAWKNAGVDIKQIRAHADLALLPLITKADLQQQPMYALISKKSTPASLRQTSGTTGVPRQFLHDKTTQIYNSVTVRRYFEEHKIALGSTVMFLHSQFDAPTPKQPMPGERYSCRIWVGVSDLLENPELARRIDADVVVGSPQQIEVVANRVYAENQISFPKAFVNIAERLTPVTREKIEASIGNKIIDVYCSSELSTLIGFECRNHCGFHINWDYVVVEVVNQKGENVEPGEQGEVVVTDLCNFVSPLIRYRLGDLATTSFNACDCQCGHALPLLISQIDGRLVDQICLDNDYTVNATTLVDNLQAHAGCQITLIQEMRKDFTLICYCSENQLSLSKNVIQKAISDYIGIEYSDLNLNICYKDLSHTLLNNIGKVRPYVSHIVRTDNIVEPLVLKTDQPQGSQEHFGHSRNKRGKTYHEDTMDRSTDC